MPCYVVPTGLKNENTRPVAEATGYTTVPLQGTIIRNLILVYNDERRVALGSVLLCSMRAEARQIFEML
jgi:hypothetical protein